MVQRTGFLKGRHIYLRPLVAEDAEGDYLQWFNDEEICRGNSHHVIPHTKEKILDYIRHARTTSEEFILAIALNETGKHIGNVAFQGIDLVYRSADLTIIIGDKSAWGKGIGMEAAGLLLNHGFNTMNLHRISCATFDSNTAMKRLALSLGMKEEGRRREAAYKDGKYVDVIEFGILKDDYDKMRERNPGE